MGFSYCVEGTAASSWTLTGPTLGHVTHIGPLIDEGYVL
jgi:hypothetical protein